MTEFQVVDILPTEVWYEKDFFGTIRVYMRHRGTSEFEFIQIHYDYRYTDNAHQLMLIKEIGKLLGIEDIPERQYRVTPEEFIKTMRGNESDCWCWNCTQDRTRMILCPECGNKRCPHATDHNLPCTNSNEPGQEGSRY